MKSLLPRKFIVSLLLVSFTLSLISCLHEADTTETSTEDADLCVKYNLITPDTDSLKPVKKIALNSLSLRSYTISESELKKISSPFNPSKNIAFEFIAQEGKNDSLLTIHKLKYTEIIIPSHDSSYQASNPEVLSEFTFRKKDFCNYNIQYSDVEQGFPSSFIQSLETDKNGNIWIGTEGNGLLRYDGNTILKYGIAQGLTSELVNLVYIDSKEDLWFVTNNNIINKFDGNFITTYKINWKNNNDIIQFISEDKRGNLFFGTAFNNILKFSQNVYSQIQFAEINSSLSFTYGKMNKKGELWISTSSSDLIKYNGLDYFHYNLHKSVGNSGITTFDFDATNNLWFGAPDKGLYVLKKDSLFRLIDSSKNAFNDIKSILIDKNNNKWISVFGKGLVSLNDTEFITLSTKDGLPKDEYIKCIVSDFNNNIWVAAYGGGLTKLKTDFKYLGKNNGLPNEFISAMSVDKGDNKWIGTALGNLIELNQNQLINYSLLKGLSTGYIFDIFNEKDATWIGSMKNGLIIKKGNIIKHYGYDASTDPNMKISSFYKDSKGTIWMGAYGNGVIEYRKDTLYFHSKKSGLSSNYVRSICEDENHNIWFGTQNGITVYDGFKFHYFIEKSGFPYKVIWNIIKTSDGSLWLSTFGKGLLRYSKGHFHLIQGKKYLPDQAVMSVLEDTLHKRLFIGTEKGLAVINDYANSNVRCDKCGVNTDEGAYTFVHQISGIKSENFSRNCSFIDKKGDVWWGGNSGITSISLDKFMLEKGTPSLEITAVKINKKNYEFNSLFSEIKREGQTTITYSNIDKFTRVPNKLILPYHLNNIYLQFSSRDFFSSGSTLYQYRINKTDTLWSDWRKDNFLELVNLSPGEYTVYIRSKNILNKVSSVLAYTFTVKPPWWKSNWFYFIMLGLLVILIGLIFKIRLHFIEKQRRTVTTVLLNTQEEERLRISRDLHDSVGQELLYLNIHTNGKYFNEIQPIIEEVRNISRNLSPTRLKETDLKTLLISLIDSICLKTDIYITYDIEDVNLDNGFFKINIYRIVQEGLSNILKHSQAKNARITLSIAHNNFILTIQDNGIGLGPENNLKGVGLSSMQERCQLIGADFKIQSNTQGTKITVTVKKYE